MDGPILGLFCTATASGATPGAAAFETHVVAKLTALARLFATAPLPGLGTVVSFSREISSTLCEATFEVRKGRARDLAARFLAPDLGRPLDRPISLGALELLLMLLPMGVAALIPPCFNTTLGTALEGIIVS